MHTEESLKIIAKELKQLYELPITNDKELQAWHVAAKAFKEHLHDNFTSISDELPHFIEHYLNDADIRFKDASYMEDQNTKIEKIIIALEKGEIPDLPDL